MNPPEAVQLDSAGWELVSDEFLGRGRVAVGRSLPWRQCRKVLTDSSARLCVIERGLRDPDVASEHAAFMADMFRPPPVAVDRYHFFSDASHPDDVGDITDLTGYLGYVTRRNSVVGPVGPSLLAPPTIDGLVSCAIPATVNAFGEQLHLPAATPFVQQDGQLGRCAHAAAWISHRTASHRGLVAEAPIAEFAGVGETGRNRRFPSVGLTTEQIAATLDQHDLPPLFHEMGRMPATGREPALPDHRPIDPPGAWDTRVIPVICRMINSGFPVIVATATHAFVIVGYHRIHHHIRGPWIQFVRHDDQLGPYRSVENVLRDVDPDTGSRYGLWAGVLTPLPKDLWMMPHTAEATAYSYLTAQHFDPDGHFAALDQADRLSLRTLARQPSALRNELGARGASRAAERIYRRTPMPPWVWVTEASDRNERQAARTVQAEVICDPTSPDDDPLVLLVRTPHGVSVDLGSSIEEHALEEPSWVSSRIRHA